MVLPRQCSTVKFALYVAHIVSQQISKFLKTLERVLRSQQYIPNIINLTNCDAFSFCAELQRLRILPAGTSTPIRHEKTTAKVAKTAEMAMRMEESVLRIELKLAEMETQHRERSNLLAELMKFKTAQLILFEELRRQKRT